jgi:hypothetical protein
MFDGLLQSENKFRRQRAKAFAKAMVSVPMLQTVCYNQYGASSLFFLG